MRKRLFSFSVILIGLCLLSISCSPSKVTTSAPTLAPVSVRTKEEAINLAQKHAMTSPIDNSERIAGLLFGGDNRGIADYSGNGKWIVELSITNYKYQYGDRKPSSFTVYRWTVFQANSSVLFLGTYGNSLIIDKLMDGTPYP